MRKLGVGVLGIGEMGKRHAENLRSVVPEARLVAVADPFPDRARQTAGELEIEKYFISLEDMLACKEVETIVIATPDEFHASTITATARAGKNIFCEKPIALKILDAETAVAEVTKAGVRMQIGFMRRYDPKYAAAMQRIEAGEIGEPVIFKSVGRDKDAPPMSAFQSGINGMLFYTNTIHDFDLARWVMRDEVTEVHAHTTCAIRPEIAQYGDVVASVVNLKFERGAIGNIESYQQAVYGYDVRTEIVGSKGAIFVGTLQRTPAVFLSANGGLQNLADHFLTTVCGSFMVGRLDDWLKVLLERENISVDPGYLEGAGVTVFKKTYKLFRQRGYRMRLLSAAFRNHMHWSEFIGGEVVISPPYAWQKRFNASQIEVSPRMDREVPSHIVEGLTRHFADFRRAYTEEGLSIADFDSFGPTRFAAIHRGMQ